MNKVLYVSCRACLVTAGKYIAQNCMLTATLKIPTCKTREYAYNAFWLVEEPLKCKEFLAKSKNCSVRVGV